MVKHLSGNTIYLVGSKTVLDTLGNYIEHGTIMRSLDFGETWSVFDTELITTFLDIEFTNDSIALISGTNGVLIKYNYRDHNLGFDEIETSNFGIEIYPNPTDGMQEIRIQTQVNEKLEIKLFDLSGKQLQLVYSGLSEHEQEKFQLDFSEFSPGIYILSVQTGDQLRYLKTQKL